MRTRPRDWIRPVAACTAVTALTLASCAHRPWIAVPDPVVERPVPDDSEVARGYLDAHNHVMSDMGFGGGLLCGRPFHPDGIDEALQDCPDHLPHGELALFENLTRTGHPPGHDPVGWPTFTDWPAWDSLTHQKNYHEWMQRAWKGGLRLMVNHLVTNRQLCEVWPAKRTGCDEMASIRAQAKMTRELEAYIDGIYGGPGRGWFRVVESSAEARRVIAEGKLAVVLGVETSEPFGCRLWSGRPMCTEQDIDRGLDEMHALGVRTMFVCHKFDNALCGVRFDPDAQGVIINAAQKLSTDRFWAVETCPTDAHDNTIVSWGTLPPPLDQLVQPGSLPFYPAGPHCNTKGLTDLGRHMVEGMIERNMVVEIDHMSAKAAEESLRILEEAGYPGVVSSHSWADPSYFGRIYALGGTVAQYGHDSEDFAKEWADTRDLRAAHGVIGYGVGIDANGFGPQPAPRTGNGVSPVEYPFTVLGGEQLDRARTGLRSWDVNTDGMAHYGLLPDWIEDLRIVAGEEIVEDLSYGAEQYIRTLEGAEGFS